MAVQISVLQTSGETLTVEVGPEMTIREFREELRRLRWEDPEMRKEIEPMELIEVQLVVENQEITTDGLVMDVISPDRPVNAIFKRRSVIQSSKEEADCSLEDPKSLCVLHVPKKVKVIPGHAFYRCTSIAELVISKGTTGISCSAFEECTSLIHVYMQRPLTVIEKDAFADCNSLRTVRIPDSVRVIGERAFWGCESLPRVTIPDSVKIIGEEAFAYCTSLQEVIVPESVTRLPRGVFKGCTSLKSVTLHESLRFIGDEAFAECHSLLGVTIPHSVSSMGIDIFYDCRSLNYPSAFIGCPPRRNRLMIATPCRPPRKDPVAELLQVPPEILRQQVPELFAPK